MSITYYNYLIKTSHTFIPYKGGHLMIEKPDHYNIPDAKYEKAIIAIIKGIHTQEGVANEASINRKTAAKIIKDPATHDIIRENAENRIKNASSEMVDMLMDIAHSSSRDDVKIDAIKHILALGGISPTSRHEVSADVKNTGQLDNIIGQISDYKVKNKRVTATEDHEEDDDD